MKQSASLSVQSFPEDAGRRRDARRQLHRIWRDGRPCVQLYVAPDLTGLERSATEFYRACPSIVCKPLFFVKREGFDFLGIEFADGANAEEALAAQTLTPDSLLESLTRLDAALQQTEEPSTPEAFGEELDALFHALRQSEILSDADQCLLDSFIAPKLKAALLTPEPKTRWTNGDFITRNMIVGPSGPKIVDYEFAARTHFYGEDWARLARYSASLPASVLELVEASLGQRRMAFDIYGLLRQIVLESRIKRVHELHFETGNIARQLIPLIDRWRIESVPSVFLPGALDPAIPGNAKAQVQVFYSHTTGFQESNTVYDEVNEGVWKRVELLLPIGAGEWNIRLDPIHCSGVLEVASVEISRFHGAESKAIALPDLTIAGTCEVAAAAPALTLICYGPDPQLHLPVLLMEGPGPFRLAVWMRWERLESGLSRAVTGLTREKANAVRRSEIRIEELAAAFDRERLSQAASEKTIAELHVRIAEGESALGGERRATTELESALEEQIKAHKQYEALVRERQRIYDGGAVQSLARIRELTASLSDARAARESLERAAVEREQAAVERERATAESASAAAERELQIRAEMERLQAVHQEAIQHERAARAQAEAVLETHSADRQEVEAALKRSLDELAQIQSKLEKELRDRHEHQHNLEKHLAAQQLRIAALERSLSWKVTAPVRQVASLFQSAPGGARKR